MSLRLLYLIFVRLCAWLVLPGRVILATLIRLLQHGCGGTGWSPPAPSCGGTAA